LARCTERILRTTERQIAMPGIDGTSLRSIATEMGWTAASLYRYFASKGELLAAARRPRHDRFSDRIEAAYASADDPWQRSRDRRRLCRLRLYRAGSVPAHLRLQSARQRTHRRRRAEAFADDDDGAMCATW
jgi:AcrR family transcriptional regulator